MSDTAVHALAEAAAALARLESRAEVLHEVAGRAQSSVPGCDDASAYLVRSRNQIEASATSGDLAADADSVQRDVGQGPGCDALTSNAAVRADDLAADDRWPELRTRASALGVRSVLAVPMTGRRGVIGVLNLYSRVPDAFGPESVAIAAAFAVHAAIALVAVEIEANLRAGLETREAIGRSVGILMERHKIDAGAAFDMLVFASQRAHRKLRDVAVWVNETGEDPDALIP